MVRYFTTVKHKTWSFGCRFGLDVRFPYLSPDFQPAPFWNTVLLGKICLEQFETEFVKGRIHRTSPCSVIHYINSAGCQV
jgi:hypothetical protein